MYFRFKHFHAGRVQMLHFGWHTWGGHFSLNDVRMQLSFDLHLLYSPA